MLFVYSLGKAQIDADGVSITPSSPRKFGILFFLLAERGHRFTRAMLRDLIFPDQTEKRAAHSLREMLYQLRLAGVQLESNPAGIQLVSPDVRSDYEDILKLERPSLEHLSAIEGGFLPGYSPTHSEAFTEWLDGFRARTTFELCRMLLREVSRARSVADWTATERAARACLALDEMNEEATLALAEMLAVGGAKVQAVKLLDRYMDDLGGDASNLRLPAATLRRRISERAPEPYRRHPTPPLVGRDEEMQILRGALSRAKAAESNGVVVWGEAGIGKTRLVSEFETLAELDGAHVHRIAVQPHDTDRPLGPFVDSIAALLELPGSLGCSPESMQTLRRLTVPTDRDRAENEILAYESVFQSVRRAIRDLIDAISSEKCFVLIIDDAHWMDAVSTRIVMEMISGDAARRLLVVLTTREPDPLREDFRHVDRLAFVELRVLDPASTARLAVAALHGLATDVDAKLVEWMQVTSGGHPLFLATLVAHYRATGARFAVPNSLRDLLARRLEALSTRARTILHICVLLGRHSTIPRLTATLTLPHIDLLEALAELDSGGLIQMALDVVAPAHPLISQTVAERTSPIAMRAAHARIATVLQETCGADELPAVLWDCAEHWSIAGESARAHAAFRACAQHALALGRPAEAARILRRALDVSASRDEAIATARELVTTASVARESQLVLDGMAALRECRVPPTHDDLEFAETSARMTLFLFDSDTEARLLCCLRTPEADPAHRWRAATYLLKLYDATGRTDLAAQVVQVADAIEFKSLPPLLRLQHDLVRYSMLEERDLVRATAHELLSAADKLPAPIAWQFLRDVGFALWRSGYVAESLAAFERLFKVAVELGAPRAQVHACVHLASIHLDLRDDRLADAWACRGLAIAEEATELRDDWSLMLIRINIAFATEQYDLARELEADAERLGVFRASDTASRWKRARDMALRASQGKLLASDAVLARELATDPGSVVRALRDVEVAAACQVLDRLGHGEEANERLRFYIEELRQPNYPLERMLLDVRDGLEARRSSRRRHGDPPGHAESAE